MSESVGRKRALMRKQSARSKLRGILPKKLAWSPHKQTSNNQRSSGEGSRQPPARFWQFLQNKMFQTKASGGEKKNKKNMGCFLVVLQSQMAPRRNGWDMHMVEASQASRQTSESYPGELGRF